jgi:bacteriorhodopsin
MNNIISINTSKNILQTTVYASLFVQVITGIFDFYVLKLNVVPSMMILKDLLLLELIVQLIEGSFYIWLAYSFVSIENITPHRYYDWFLTTPTMLITFSIYLIYLKNEYEQKLNTNTTKTINNDTDTFVQILQKNAYIFIPILILNALMLIFGYLGEINIIKEKIAVLCGFIPFILCFTLIYEKYAKYSEQGLILFWYFVSVWSLYGVAALFPYNLKNIFYNILDLFAKNFFGLYLAYIIWHNKI